MFLVFFRGGGRTREVSPAAKGGTRDKEDKERKIIFGVLLPRHGLKNRSV